MIAVGARVSLTYSGQIRAGLVAQALHTYTTALLICPPPPLPQCFYPTMKLFENSGTIPDPFMADHGPNERIFIGQFKNKTCYDIHHNFQFLSHSPI